MFCNTILLKYHGVGYVYIEESFDNIFNMGYGGGAYNAPPPWIIGRENRPWTIGLMCYVKCKKNLKLLFLIKVKLR